MVRNNTRWMTAETVVAGAVGVSVPLSKGGLRIEPYVSPGIRYRDLSGGSTGYAVGTNLDFGVIGLHIAYDTERLKGGGTDSVFGFGVHLS